MRSLSLSGLNGVFGPLMEPEVALTVSGVLSNARGVVVVRWVRKTNPMMIKQFIYMYLQQCREFFFSCFGTYLALPHFGSKTNSKIWEPLPSITLGPKAVCFGWLYMTTSQLKHHRFGLRTKRVIGKQFVLSTTTGPPHAALAYGYSKKQLKIHIP